MDRAPGDYHGYLRLLEMECTGEEEHDNATRKVSFPLDCNPIYLTYIQLVSRYIHYISRYSLYYVINMILLKISNL